MTGALIGLLSSTGLLLVLSGWARTRGPTLEQRLSPYIRDVHPYVVPTSQRGGVLSALFGPSIRRAGEAVGNILGGSASVTRRLVRLGSTTSLEEFRIIQVMWGAAGLTVATVASAFLWSELGTPVQVLLVICAVGFLGGALSCDSNLSRRVTAHEREVQAEFPVIADLLALAVAAGEGPVSGLERILAVCHGALSDELVRVVTEIHTGTPMAQAFDALAARTGVTSIARFAEGLSIAVERGTPLVDVLHAQAADVREAARRDLIEAGGRKEVAMMIPVVFLILPVTVIFAFFPGYIGLHLTSGT